VSRATQLGLFTETPANHHLPEQAGEWVRDRRDGEHRGRIYYTAADGTLLVIKGPAIPDPDAEWHVSATRPEWGTPDFETLAEEIASKGAAVRWAVDWMQEHDGAEVER